MSDDFTHDTSTTGSVAVGGTATGEIEARNDIDWFAVELVAGRHYVIDLEGADSGGGTLDSTVLRGLYDADGNHIVGSHSNFGGDGEDARLTFTATESGKYFIAARGSAGATTGTYTVRVTESAFSDGERAGAKDLGDITDLRGARFPNTTLDGDGDTADYFRFTLSEAKAVELGLRQQDANADLFLEDAQGTVLASSTESGTANERIVQTLLAGTYYIRVEAQEAGANQFKLRYGVSDADAAAVAALEAQRQTEQQGEQQAPVNQAPTFGEPSYAFDLAELADGSVTAVALGTVSASDPEGATLIYSIEEGNDAGLFEIDESTGALTYTGSGEDYESGTTSYPLTVRASDGTHTADVAVTVSVTDVEEAPAFDEPSYAFDLAELADGSSTAVALGTVSATDPQNDTLTYSIAAGNDDGLFEIDESTGALTYTGTGEDYESDTKSYPLTVRASDGTHTADVTVTVSVTDVEEAPTFGEPSYAFDLAELADGSTTAVALGTVSATDPQNDTVTYSIATGNDDALFEIDRATGALTYTGTGEDYESGTTSYPLTVRASDGTHTTDVTVTVRVTDVEEAPTFGEPSYAFDLAELADGSDTAVALGTVSATDPQNDTLTYSIAAGNDAGLFEIDRATGALSYTGTGEDYETAPTSYELTVRASDGTHTTDVAVTIRVTDVPGDGDPSVSQEQQSTPQTVSEPSGEDLPTDTTTTGRIAVGGTATGEIGRRADIDWFAVELVADRTYTIDLRGSPTGHGTLRDTYLRGIYDSSGKYIPHTRNDDSGGSRNSQVEFTASETGTHYIAAGGFGNRTGTYELEVTDTSAQTFGQASYAFDLAENVAGNVTAVALGTVSATDPEGDTLTYSIAAGNDDELFEIDPATGALSYKGPGEDYESDTKSYALTVRASDGANATDVSVTVNVTNVADTLAFEEPSYAFDLAENVAGNVAAVALGTVSATDPGGDTLTYSIEDGNDDALFEIDRATGSLTYKGTGEDYETVPTSYELTVRASDGTNTTDVAVTVRVTDLLDPGESVSEADAEDFPASVSTTGQIAIGDTVTGNIEDYRDSQDLYGYDQDWFAVELVANRTYLIDLRGSSTDDNPLRDPLLGGIYDDSGTFIAGTNDDDGGDGRNSRVTFTPTMSGTYYVAARGSFHDGAYELEVKDTTGITVPEPDDFAAGTSTIGNLEFDSDTGVALAYGDIDTGDDLDWFAMELEAGQSVIIRVTGFDPEARSYDGGIDNPQIVGVYTADSELLAGTTSQNARAFWSESFGDESRIVSIGGGGPGAKEARIAFKAEDAGTYYVAVGSHYSSQTGKYTVAVSPGPAAEDDYTDDTATGGKVAVGGSLEGKIEWQDDVDWIAVDLTGGMRYELGLAGAEDSRESPYFGSYIRDGNGNPYADWDGDSASKDRVWVELTDGDNTHDHGYFTPMESGTYYVPVVGGSSDSFWFGNNTLNEFWDEALSYTLSVAEAPVPEDDVAADTSTTGEVEVGGDAVYSRIDAMGDADWYAVELDSANRYAFVISSVSGSDDPLSRGQIAGLYDSAGNRIPDSSSQDQSSSGRDAVLTWQPETTGTYYAAVASSMSTEDTGDYRFAVSELPADDMSADTDTEGTLSVGGSASGFLETFGDVDWLAVELEAGQAYSFDVEFSLDVFFNSRIAGDSMEDWFDEETGLPLLHVGSFSLEGLYDADSARVVAPGDDSSSFTYTPSEDGTFYVAVQGGTWDPIGHYEVTAEEVTDAI